MEFCHDFIEQLTSEDEFTVLDSILHIKDVLLENVHIEILLKNKELLEAVFGVCSEDQQNEELILSCLDLIHILIRNVNAYLHELSDPDFCRISKEQRQIDGYGFPMLAKNFSFVVLDKLSRLCLRETNVFEKVAQITQQISQILLRCFAPIFNIQNMTVESEDADDVKKIITQFSEVLQELRSEVLNCEEIEAIRLFRRYYTLIMILCELLPATVTEFGALLVVPTELSEEFSLVLLNHGFKLKHPRQWSYIDNFLKTNNEELATQCGEIMQIANLFYSFSSVIYRSQIFTKNELISSVEESLLVLSFQIGIIVESVDTLLECLIYKDESDDYLDKARQIVMKMMAHPYTHIKIKTYAFLAKMAKGALGVAATIKTESKDLQFLRLLVQDELVSEIFFSLMDDSEHLNKFGQDILLYLMKGYQMLPLDLQAVLKDSILSPDNPLEFHVFGDESLQDNFMMYIASALQEPQKLIERFMRFLFWNNEHTRRKAVEMIMPVLETSPSTKSLIDLVNNLNIDLSSLVYTEEVSSVSYRALLTADFDLERLDVCTAQIEDEGIELAQKRAALNELQILLDSPELQKVFLSRGGFSLLIKSLILATNNGLEDVIYPLVSTLFNLYIGHTSYRAELVETDFISATLLKALIFMRSNPTGRKLTVQLLCLVVYFDNLQVFIAENKDVNMEDNVSIFIPSVANRSVKFPFQVTFFSIESKNKDPESVLPEEVTKYFVEDFSNFSLLRLAWKLGQYGNVKETIDNYVAGGEADFQLSPLEYWRLLSLEIFNSVEKELKLIENAETHDEFCTALASLSLTIEHAKVSGVKELNFEWMHSFKKYFLVTPVSNDDKILMRNVLNFFSNVIRMFSDTTLIDWLKTQFLNADSVIMTLFEEACIILREDHDFSAATYSCFRSIIRAAEILSNFKSEEPVFEHIVTLLGWNLQASTDRDERFVSLLLSSLVILLQRCKPPEEECHNLLMSSFEVVNRLQTDRKGTLKKICLLCIKLNSNPREFEQLLVDNVRLVLLCVSAEDKRLRTCGLNLLVLLLKNKQLLDKTDSIIGATLEGGVLTLGLRLLHSPNLPPLLANEILHFSCQLSSHNKILPKPPDSKNIYVLLDAICNSKDLSAQLSGFISLSTALVSLSENKLAEFLRIVRKKYLANILERIRLCASTGRCESVIFILEVIKRSEKTCIHEQFEIVAAEVLIKVIKNGNGSNIERAASVGLVKLLECSISARTQASELNLDIIVGDKLIELALCEEKAKKKNKLKKATAIALAMIVQKRVQRKRI
ncbi:hypothetical protein QYM36_006974 [Artemia franciscana]|uniref:Uncharacterized protein n=1 Tax=Artemia franciscana TaxID=6661 RepID=A0AA88LCT0_ARTSF|nr:hypothetical protein QYM36_006974 [Artemia franciscana]